MATVNLCGRCGQPNKSHKQDAPCEDCATYRDLSELGVTFSTSQRSRGGRPSRHNGLSNAAAFSMSKRRGFK